MTDLVLKNSTISKKLGFQIFVDSRKRIQGTPNNFTYQIKNLYNLKKVYATVVDYVFTSTYHITSNNNKLVFSELASNITVSITPGTYTISEVCSALTTVFNNASQNSFKYSFVYNSNTNKITFSTTSNTASGQLLFNSNDFTAKEWLSENSSTPVNFSFGNSYTFSLPYNPVSIPYLFLRCDECNSVGSFYTENQLGNSFLCKINNGVKNTLSYFTIGHISYSLKLLDLSSGKITFSLVDPNGRFYTEPVADFSFTINCYAIE